ncbi:hypothetical protein [Methanobrevibacter sp.]|uniref:hypothetical protein n=1 Tax=Methanobrevibacter sp. TaxID=66852 RepID=UPI0038910308
MKKIALVMLIFMLVGCAYAEEFSKVTVNGADFEIPEEYSSGDLKDNKYVFKDLRTFAILCVDDYIISNYGGNYKISDSSQEMSIDGRPCMHLCVYNKYIDKNVSYLYFPVEKSVYCICYQGNDVNSGISHIVESALPSNISDDAFYGLLDEAFSEYQNRQYLDSLSGDNSYYSEMTGQHSDNGNDQLIKWYLITHW